MSSVTLGRDLERWQWARPEAESRATTGGRRRFAARTSGEVVLGTDLMVLAFAAVAFTPHVLRWPVAVFVLGVLGVCALRGQYASRITLSISKDLGTVALAVTVPLMAIATLDGFDPRVRPYAELAVASLALLLLGRAFAYAGIRRTRTNGGLSRRVLIVGAGQVAERFADVLEEYPGYGLHPVGLLDDCADETLSHPMLGGIDELDDVLRRHRIDQVVLAFGVNRDPDLVRVIRSCENADVDMYVVPRFFELGIQTAAQRRRHGLGVPPGAPAPVDPAILGPPGQAGLRLGISIVMLALVAPIYAVLAAGREAHQPGSRLLPPEAHREERA